MIDYHINITDFNTFSKFVSRIFENINNKYVTITEIKIVLKLGIIVLLLKQ